MVGNFKSFVDFTKTPVYFQFQHLIERFIIILNNFQEKREGDVKRKGFSSKMYLDFSNMLKCVCMEKVGVYRLGAQK